MNGLVDWWIGGLVVCRRLRPLYPEHHLTPSPMTRSLPLVRPSRASAPRIPFVASQATQVRHFMAERETERCGMFRAPLKIRMDSTEQMPVLRSYVLAREEGGGFADLVAGVEAAPFRGGKF